MTYTSPATHLYLPYLTGGHSPTLLAGLPVRQIPVQPHPFIERMSSSSRFVSTPYSTNQVSICIRLAERHRSSVLE